jgi:phosphoenolpyruvate carboxykinase (ATP)
VVRGREAIVQGIVEGSIAWETDPDFGYEVATSVPGVEDLELLEPGRLYRRQGRLAEYEEMVARLQKERAEYLAAYAMLDPAVAAGL